MLYRIEYAAVCHRGKLRPTNQDNYFCCGQYLPADHSGTDALLKGTFFPKQTPLLAVFDGMGGEEHGEMASYLAAQAMEGQVMNCRDQSLLDACLTANRNIVRFAEIHRLNTCGTTAAMLLFNPDGVAQCHIGDSRIYRFRDGQIDQLTRDDVFPAPGRGKPPLLQYLGIPEAEMCIEPHTAYHEAIINDIYLVCSDGLSDMVPEHMMADIIRGIPVCEASERLLQSALDAGGRDNITFFLIHLLPA